MSNLRRTTLKQGPPGPPGTQRSAPTSWTPGVITNGSFAKLVVTVTGALTGFPCLPPAWSIALPDGVWLYGQVTSASSVTVYMMNNSGVSQTIAAGVVYVEVLNQ